LEEFTRILEDQGLKIGMEGKIRYTGTLFIERLWRTTKYEKVYLKTMRMPEKPGLRQVIISGSVIGKDLVNHGDTRRVPRSTIEERWILLGRPQPYLNSE
jgi:hypothetical protein